MSFTADYHLMPTALESICKKSYMTAKWWPEYLVLADYINQNNFFADHQFLAIFKMCLSIATQQNVLVYQANLKENKSQASIFSSR